MRIVLAGKYVPSQRPIGGLQSWIKTVGDELKRRGHEVVEWQPGMRAAGFFDLGIIANLKYTRPILNLCRQSVCVSHGIIPDEKPQSGCDRYLFVSEGVRNHWDMTGDIIRQPIDLKFWRPGKGGKRILRYSYRSAEVHGKAAAGLLGLPYAHLKDATHEQARKEIQRSGCVLATGRAALEAMACNVPTVIYDHRSAYQPALMDTDLERQMANSYSGRGGHVPTVSEVVEAIDRAMAITDWRGWVERHHDVRKAVDCLLS